MAMRWRCERTKNINSMTVQGTIPPAASAFATNSSVYLPGKDTVKIWYGT